MDEKIKTARVQLGQFIKERRLQLGRTAQELGEFVGVTANTIKGVETGRFACDVDLLLSICAALDVKPIFAPLEELGGGAMSTLPEGPAFILAPDHQAGELYILHRGHPACLIHVVQTNPATFRIVDNYSDLDPEELAIHPFLEDAKTFFKNYAKNNLDRN